MMAGNLFLLPIVLLLLGICGPLNEVAANATEPAGGGGTSTPQLNVSIAPADAAIWQTINKSSVETVCLQKAKEKAGANAWAVGDCTCGETVGEGVKEYDCSISTFQGTISAHVACVLADRACSLESPQGNGSMTFDEIEQLQTQK